MADNNKPNCLKNKISTKRVMMSGAEVLCSTLRQTTHNDAHLVLLTNGGIISGIPASAEEYLSEEFTTPTENINEHKVNLFSLGKLRYTQIQEMEKKEPELEVIDNGSYICLKDATYKTGDISYNFGEIIVFADQIQGLALSDRNILAN